MCKNHGWRHYHLEMQHVADIVAKECDTPPELLDDAREAILGAATVQGMHEMIEGAYFLDDETRYRLMAKVAAYREAVGAKARELLAKTPVKTQESSESPPDDIPW